MEKKKESNEKLRNKEINEKASKKKKRKKACRKKENVAHEKPLATRVSSAANAVSHIQLL